MNSVIGWTNCRRTFVKSIRFAALKLRWTFGKIQRFKSWLHVCFECLSWLVMPPSFLWKTMLHGFTAVVLREQMCFFRILECLERHNHLTFVIVVVATWKFQKTTQSWSNHVCMFFIPPAGMHALPFSSSVPHVRTLWALCRSFVHSFFAPRADCLPLVHNISLKVCYAQSKLYMADDWCSSSSRRCDIHTVA